MQTPLELRYLRTLLALREAGNLSRAAQLLNLTQSALSHQLKGLEDHYGTELFERKSSPLSFGVAGQRLLKLAELVLPQIDEADRDVRKLVEGSAGQLRIAVECHTCFDWLMPAMDAFRERWPEVELDIVSGFPGWRPRTSPRRPTSITRCPTRCWTWCAACSNPPA